MKLPTDELQYYTPRLDYRAISPWTFRTARIMTLMLWIRSPAFGLDPAQPRRPTDLFARQDDIDLLEQLADGPTRLLATWKARTLFLRALERYENDDDQPTPAGLARRHGAALIRWCRAVTTPDDIVFLHALLYRSHNLQMSIIGDYFRRHLFDPMVALSAVRAGAAEFLPVATRRQRGPVAQAQRRLLADWTRWRYGLGLDDPGARRRLLHLARRCDSAGDVFLCEHLHRQCRRSAGAVPGEENELFDWVQRLPARAFR